MDKKYYFVKAQVQEIEEDIERIMFDAGAFRLMVDKYIMMSADCGYDQEEMKEYFKAVFGTFFEEEMMKYIDY